MEIEGLNSMAEGTILWARWIKPVARRSASQMCGHAIFSFLMPQAANEVLANGMVICQKRSMQRSAKNNLYAVSSARDGATLQGTVQRPRTPVAPVHNGIGPPPVRTQPGPTVFLVGSAGMLVGIGAVPFFSISAVK